MPPLRLLCIFMRRCWCLWLFRFFLHVFCFFLRRWCNRWLNHRGRLRRHSLWLHATCLRGPPLCRPEVQLWWWIAPILSRRPICKARPLTAAVHFDRIRRQCVAATAAINFNPASLASILVSGIGICPWRKNPLAPKILFSGVGVVLPVPSPTRDSAIEPAEIIYMFLFGRHCPLPPLRPGDGKEPAVPPVCQSAVLMNTRWLRTRKAELSTGGGRALRKERGFHASTGKSKWDGYDKMNQRARH